MLRAELLPVTTAVPWRDVAERLRPFVAHRVAPSDVDDVLQDVLLRMHRGLGALADEQRFVAWMYQVARSAIAEHGRARGRHPIADGEAADAPSTPELDVDTDRAAATALAACLTGFVARLASPYREAITLVELEGLSTRAAAELVGISVPGMKSRVQRGRAQLRELLDACCAIAVDARGKVTEVTPRPRDFCCSAERPPHDDGARRA